MCCLCVNVYRTVSYRTVPYLTVPYRTVPYRSVPYCTVPYRTVPYRSVPYCTVLLSLAVNPIAVNKYNSVNIKRLVVWGNNTYRYTVHYPIRELHSYFHYYFKGAHPGVFLAQLRYKRTVNTTKFHRNNTTCFGPLDPSSNAHRFELCRHMVIITCLYLSN